MHIAIKGSCPIAYIMFIMHFRSMSLLTPLEVAAIRAVAGELPDHAASDLRDRIAHASVTSRENTGGGFYSDLVIDMSRLLDGRRYLGDAVYVAVRGLDFGIGIILHIKDCETATLEGYAIGTEDTSGIDFGNVRFAIAAAPGPLPPDRC